MGVGTVDLTLDRQRQLKFDHNALADLDMALIKTCGKSLFGIMSEISEENPVPFELAGPGGTRLLLYHGLKWQDKSLTIQRVGIITDSFLDSGGSFDKIVEATWMGLVKSGAFGSPDELLKEADEQQGKVEAVKTQESA